MLRDVGGLLRIIGNIAPDTDRDLIEQHFKVKILEIQKTFLELYAKKIVKLSYLPTPSFEIP